jgi:LacI family transcriptional regulator
MVLLDINTVICYYQKMDNHHKVAIVIDKRRTYERELLRGISRYSRLYAQWVYYPSMTHSLRDRSLAITLKNILQWKPDGLILNFTDVMPKILENSTNIPTIFINYPTHQEATPLKTYVAADLQALALSGVRYLTGHGFKNYAFCGYRDNPRSEEFSNHFCDLIAEQAYHTDIYEQPKSRVNQYWDKEQHFLMRWVQSLPKPVAIMANDDIRAQHLTVICKQLNLDIPFEVSILGCTNDELLCETTTPTLSSIAMNINRAGYEAARTLAAMMDHTHHNPANIIIEPTHVVSRISTEYLAVDDADTVTAMRYIRYNTYRDLQVNDIVEQTTVSRSVLETKFRQFTGRTINQEIGRVRSEQIGQMLVETDLSITEIAYATGFKNVEHIARYFKKEKKMSPRDYRKRYKIS